MIKRLHDKPFVPGLMLVDVMCGINCVPITRAAYVSHVTLLCLLDYCHDYIRAIVSLIHFCSRFLGLHLAPSFLKYQPQAIMALLLQPLSHQHAPSPVCNTR